MKIASEKKLWILAFFLLVWAVAATTVSSYYYVQFNKYNGLYEDAARKLGEVSISVNLAIDYGNKSSRTWFNNTIVPIGATLYNATVKVAEIETHPLYPSFVTAINSVKQSETQNMYWGWWYWDETELKWILGPVGFNEYTLHDKQTLIWYYSKAEWPPTPPP